MNQPEPSPKEDDDFFSQKQEGDRRPPDRVQPPTPQAADPHVPQTDYSEQQMNSQAAEIDTYTRQTYVLDEGTEAPAQTNNIPPESAQANESPPPVEAPVADASSSSSRGEAGGVTMPPAVRLLLGQYLTISQKLLLAPRVFFREMQCTGITEPATFLAISSFGNAFLNAIMHGFNLLSIPGRFVMESVASLLVAGLAYMMAKGMGSKASFEAVFRVAAFCSCLNVLAPIPGIQFFTGVYSLVLYFFGFKQVLGVSMYQTVTIMFLIGFMQVIVSLGRMLSP